MIVTILNTNAGDKWGNYVLKNNNRNGKATVIVGDTILGDEICKSLRYKSGNAVNFVISFSNRGDDVNQIRGREIVKDFIYEFMQGFSNDEYHMDIVEHNDTANLHYHIRIPKLNLLTNTQLKLYWHRSDLSYKKAIIDLIANRYDLLVGDDRKYTIKPNSKKNDYIDKCRDIEHRDLLDLSKKKYRRDVEKDLTDFFIKNIKINLIESLDEIKSELIDMGFDVIKEDYDRGREFHYLTIENESGKLRIKGDIYAREFYNNSPEDRTKRVEYNQSTRKRSPSDRQSRDKIGTTLQREYKKRLQFIDTQYTGARKRAIKRFQDSYRKAERSNQTKLSKTSRADQSISKPKKQPYQITKNTLKLSPTIYPIGRIRYWSISYVEYSTIQKDGLNSTKNHKNRWYILPKSERFKTIYKNNKQGKLDDTLRAEITNIITDATKGIYQRITEDYQSLQSKYGYSDEYHQQTERVTKQIRKTINQFADKYQSRAVREIAERYEQEGKILYRANKELKRGVKECSDIYKEFGGRVEEYIDSIKKMISNSVDIVRDKVKVKKKKKKRDWLRI